MFAAPTVPADLRDPELQLARLKDLDGRGQRPPLYLFYGHHGRLDTVGPWVLSQWYPASFTVDGVTYPNAEVFMMTAKAWLFDDQEVLADLAGVSDPQTAKRLGRLVRGFDQAIWDAHAFGFVVAANLAKFSQHRALGEFLVRTAPATLVEASPSDRIWGIGLGVSDPRSQSPLQWRGRNLLGFALTEVRARLPH